jgi:mono/diheme cytochrome c family protein
MMGSQMMGSSPRHHQAMMNGIPAAYASLRNPLPANTATLASGRLVYEQNCALCHGDSGNGNGPAATQLKPPPANLRWSAQMPMSRSDGYLYWAIAEGGQPFGTAMPAFKRSLSKQQIWAVIAYIQAGLPAATK